MNLLNPYFKTIIKTCLVLSVNIFFAQQGSVIINQAPELDALLTLKKEMNVSDNDSDRYKIQIYSGNRDGAKKARKKFNKKFEEIDANLEYETPNYKIWVGNFRSRLEADRALIRVKKEFKDAFRFKPNRTDKLEE